MLNRSSSFVVVLVLSVANVLAQAPSCAKLSEAKLIELLVAKVSDETLQGLVTRCGIEFAPDSAALSRLTAAGASPSLQAVLRVLAPPVAAPALPSSAVAPATMSAASGPAVDMRGLKVDFVLVAPGEFLMGRKNDKDLPQHRVRLTRPFEIGRCEVSQALWEAFMGYDHSFRLEKKPEKKLGQPVTNVSWEETQSFIAKLNAQGDGYRYRLPSEAEWEFVATAANTNQARDYTVRDGGVNACGKLQPNAWGVYDMPGNASEWVNDWYDEKYYAQSPATDPLGPATGAKRVLRGLDNASLFADSGRYDPYTVRGGGKPTALNNVIGFRLVREKP
jgi:formylglycine-generating enzyme required for sulfatase activity